MDTQKALDVVKNLKGFYDSYSEAFTVVIGVIEQTLSLQLGELESKKSEVDRKDARIVVLEKQLTDVGIEPSVATEIIEIQP